MGGRRRGQVDRALLSECRPHGSACLGLQVRTYTSRSTSLVALCLLF